MAKRPTGQATVARQLARKVQAARTDKARYHALVAVMRALHVGVYTGKGKPLARGAERGPKDLYLYTIELRILADALQAKETTSVDGLAALLNPVLVKGGRKGVTAVELRGLLIRATKSAAARPTNRLTLAPLLIRELGLRHRPAYDLGQKPSLKRLRFDALQTFLISADAFAPLLRKSARGGQSMILQDFHGVFSRPADEPCTGNGFRGYGKTLPGLGWLASILNNVGKYPTATGPGLGLATTILDAIHAGALAWSVKATFSSRETTTHLGPAGHAGEAGKGLHYTLKVEFKNDYGQVVINCGALLMEFPDKGPIEGVEVLWDTAGGVFYTGGGRPIPVPLERFGTITYDPSNKVTGHDGSVTLNFKPKEEIIPGLGDEYTATGPVDAIALYQSAFGSIIGSVAERVGTVGDNSAWTVSWHKPMGLKFAGARFHWTDTQTDSYGTFVREHDEDWSGRVCGDPFANSWTIKIHAKTAVTEAPPGWPRPIEDYTSERPGIFLDYAGDLFTLLPGPPPGMHMHYAFAPESPGVSVLNPTEGSVTVPIEEDRDCPSELEDLLP